MGSASVTFATLTKEVFQHNSPSSLLPLFLLLIIHHASITIGALRAALSHPLPTTWYPDVMWHEATFLTELFSLQDHDSLHALRAGFAISLILNIMMFFLFFSD